jgi:hypothetical protein
MHLKPMLMRAGAESSLGIHSWERPRTEGCGETGKFPVLRRHRGDAAGVLHPHQHLEHAMPLASVGSQNTIFCARRTKPSNISRTVPKPCVLE